MANGKDNTKHCPCCGSPIEQTEWLFKEQHDAEWKQQRGVNDFRVINGLFGATYGIGAYGRNHPKPLPLINWEQANPIPKMNMVEFVVTLHHRIAALEAKLAEMNNDKNE